MTMIQPNEFIFTIPTDVEDEYVLFAPLHKLAVKISQNAANTIHELIEHGYDSFQEKSKNENLISNFFKKHHLLELPNKWKVKTSKNTKELSRITLALTNKCNLRCSYCYANGGIDQTSMSFDTVRDGIDTTIKHANFNKNNCIYVKFHGGGEAFVEYELLKKSVDYIIRESNKNALHPHLRIVTNLTLITPRIANWLKENQIYVTASLDGKRDIQNIQRPNANGHGSYNKAIQGLLELKKAGVQFEIRATVTNESVSYMVDFVKFLGTEIFEEGIGAIHFEPVAICGRANQSALEYVNPETYFNNYIQAYEVGKLIGINVVCSFDTFNREKVRHCGTSKCTMFCLTPNGNISACSRVTKETDSGADLFFYGHYHNKERFFEVDTNKVNQVTSHGELPKKECSTCFARWGCQGHCPIARYTDPDYTNYACHLVKSLLKYKILAQLS